MDRATVRDSRRHKKNYKCPMLWVPKGTGTGRAKAAPGNQGWGREKEEQGDKQQGFGSTSRSAPPALEG